jgi:hypothetical protein
METGLIIWAINGFKVPEGLALESVEVPFAADGWVEPLLIGGDSAEGTVPSMWIGDSDIAMGGESLFWDLRVASGGDVVDGSWDIILVDEGDCVGDGRTSDERDGWVGDL